MIAKKYALDHEKIELTAVTHSDNKILCDVEGFHLTTESYPPSQDHHYITVDRSRAGFVDYLRRKDPTDPDSSLVFRVTLLTCFDEKGELIFSLPSTAEASKIHGIKWPAELHKRLGVLNGPLYESFLRMDCVVHGIRDLPDRRAGFSIGIPESAQVLRDRQQPNHLFVADMLLGASEPKRLFSVGPHSRMFSLGDDERAGDHSMFVKNTPAFQELASTLLTRGCRIAESEKWALITTPEDWVIVAFGVDGTVIVDAVGRTMAHRDCRGEARAYWAKHASPVEMGAAVPGKTPASATLCAASSVGMCRLFEIVRAAFRESGDNVCFRDIYNAEVAAIVGVPFEPGLLPKDQFIRNCNHYYDCLASNKDYKTPAPVDPRVIRDLLNAMLELDDQATMALICARVPANKSLQNDPDIVVEEHRVLPDAGIISIMSVLNSLCLASGNYVGFTMKDGRPAFEVMAITGASKDGTDMEAAIPDRAPGRPVQ